MLLRHRHQGTGRSTRDRRGFRPWRRGRPFSGGLLTLLAGVEIFGTTQLGGLGLEFHTGPTGFLSWLIPAILVACGLLMWFSPQQRVFYAVVALVTAVFSLIAVNLGGFLLGMLLGVVGGALGFAWTPGSAWTPGFAWTPGSTAPGSPADPAPVRRPDPAASDPPEPGQPAFEPPASDPPASDRLASDRPASGAPAFEPPASGRSASGPFVAVVALACLAATGVTAATAGSARPAYAGPVPGYHAAPGSGYAAPCPAAGSVRPAPSESTSAAPAAPTPSPSASAPTEADGGDDGGNIITDIIGGIWDLLTGGGGERPAGDPPPSPTDPAAEPGPGDEPTATPTPARPGTCPPPGAPPGPSPSPSDEPVVPKLAPEPGQPLVNREPSRLTGSKVTMYGLRLDGIVELPTASGPLRTLRFSMDRAVTDDFDLRIPGPAGQALDFRSSALTVAGDVRFYATRFSGRLPLLGIKITLTPDSPLPPDGIPLTLPRIVFDDPEMRLAFVECDRLTAPHLDEGFR